MLKIKSEDEVIILAGKDKGTKETKKQPALSPKEKKKAKDAKKK